MPTSTNSTGPIMDVWQNNLDVEVAKIRSIVQQYPYIAMVNLICSLQCKPCKMCLSLLIDFVITQCNHLISEWITVFLLLLLLLLLQLLLNLGI